MGRYAKTLPVKKKEKTEVFNSFKILEVDDDEEDEEGVMVQHVECDYSWNEGECRWKKLVKEIRWVSDGQKNKQKDLWLDLGYGDIIVDSAADESCRPVGKGDAYPTKATDRRLRLRTANGGEMKHDGQKDSFFEGGQEGGPLGLRFHVTDVNKPLLSVRRLVECGSTVVLSAEDGESYIMNHREAT